MPLKRIFSGFSSGEELLVNLDTIYCSNLKPRALITNWVHPEVIAHLENACEVIPNPTRESWSRERVISLTNECEAMIAFMPDRVDEAVLAACPKLRIIACALKGADNFDVAACTQRGVWLTVVPDLLTVPTAELAIGPLLAVTRRFLPGDDHVRSGAFEGWRPELYGAGLNGKALGIVGFGAVGQAIAARVATFGVTTVYSDSKSVPGEYEHVAFEKLLKMSDFVMPLVPLTTETHHLVNATALNGMKRGAYLVNVGRGSVVDEAAVADALAANHLSGYAADVFEMEDWALGARPRAIHRALLADRKRTFFTPHLGSAVDNARLAIAMEAAENVLDALACRRPRGAINNPLKARG